MGWDWASVGLDGHLPAPALAGRRKANRSRNCCIFLERLTSQMLLVFPPARLLIPKRGRKGRVGT